MIMSIIEFFSKFLKGRGLLPSILVISSWFYILILSVDLILQFIFYVTHLIKNKNSLEK